MRFSLLTFGKSSKQLIRILCALFPGCQTQVTIFDRFCQVYNRHHVLRTACGRERLLSFSTTGSAAAAARWLLPAAAPTYGSRSYSPTWANGSHLLPTYRTATAATSAAGHHPASSGDGGANSTCSVIRSAHRPFMCHVVVLWMSFWTDRVYLRK